MSLLKLISPLILLVTATTPAQSQSAPQQLRDVKTIYVGSLGEGQGPSLIRSKVITYLVKSRQISVVESAEGADAILVGAAKQEPYLDGSGDSRDHATAGVRLVGRDQRILWADDVSNGIFASGHSTILPNASTSLAERIAKRLLKAIADDGKPAGVKR